MMTERQSDRVATIGLLMGGATLYLLTLSRYYSADSILIAQSIEQSRLYHPAHPLLWPSGWLFVQLWRWLGWQGRALLPLQALNALAGAVCVALLYLLIRRPPGRLVDRRVALPTAAGWLYSNGLWLLSSDAEFVTPALAAQLGFLGLMLWPSAATRTRLVYAVALGVGLALATLSWALALSLAALIPWLVWPVGTAGRRRQLAVMSGAALAVLLPVWLSRPPLWPYPASYAAVSLRDLPQAAYAFVRTLIGFPGLGLSGHSAEFFFAAPLATRLAFVGVYVAAGMLAAWPLVALWRQRATWAPALRRVVTGLTMWGALLVVFAVWWVAGDVSFWLPVAALWWWAVGLALADAPARRLRSVGALIVGLGLYHGLTLIGPQHNLAHNIPYAWAQDIAALTDSADLILTPDNNLLALYLPYFADRSTLPLFAAPPDPAVQAEYNAAVQSALRAHPGALWLAQIADAPWLAPLADAWVGQPVWRDGPLTLTRLQPAP